MRAIMVLTIGLLAGCGIAAGPFGGSAPRVNRGGGYATASVGPSSPSGSGKHVGAFICANCGYGFGTMPGYGHTSITRNGQTVEITDVNLRFFIEWLFRFHPMVNIALASSFETDKLDEPDGLGGEKEVEFGAFASMLNWNIMLTRGSRLWFGGGYAVSGVGGTSGNGFRGVAGVQTNVGSVGFARVLLRVEAALTRGANDFKQEWVNGGFVFWFDPNWRP